MLSMAEESEAELELAMLNPLIAMRKNAKTNKKVRKDSKIILHKNIPPKSLPAIFYTDSTTLPKTHCVQMKAPLQISNILLIEGSFLPTSIMDILTP
jgi:hypothetical protein